MIFHLPLVHRPLRTLRFENLETRINLAGEGVGETDTHEAQPCVFESSVQGPAARAAHAINCFAVDLYEHFEREEGNLFLSPLSISTALAMTHAGADGETATEMRDVLHFGPEPGISESFKHLLDSLGQVGQGLELELANALWPQEGFPFHDEYIQGIEANYDGRVQALNYADHPNQARDTINAWVEDRTHGRVEDLIAKLSPLTRMVLTNAIYFKSDWAAPFDKELTQPRPFVRADGTVVDVPTMSSVDKGFYRYTELDGFQILVLNQGEWSEPPSDALQPTEFKPGRTSMVILLPKEGHTTDDLTPETMARVNHWLENSQDDYLEVDIYLPKFKTTVASNLIPVLEGMGMPRMFDYAEADFTGMTDVPSFHIMQVRHKASLEVNEKGTEATGATAVVGGIVCFAAGTPILTANGEKSIEEIQVGDYVLSRDEHNVDGQIVPKRVEETFRNRGEILELHVGGRIIRTTNEHPFFVRERGWTAAQDLKSGDWLATDLSSWMEVEKIAAALETDTVYNFRVADHHTYFVGSQDWGFAVWAHNRYGPTALFDANHPFHFFIRDDISSAILFMGRVSDPSQAENDLVPTVETDSAEPLPGDADGDDDVDFADFILLAANFGKTEDAVFAEGDFNADGAIDFSDFLVLQQNFGTRREAAV